MLVELERLLLNIRIGLPSKQGHLSLLPITSFGLLKSKRVLLPKMCWLITSVFRMSGKKLDWHKSETTPSADPQEKRALWVMHPTPGKTGLIVYLAVVFPPVNREGCDSLSFKAVKNQLTRKWVSVSNSHQAAAWKLRYSLSQAFQVQNLNDVSQTKLFKKEILHSKSSACQKK